MRGGGRGKGTVGMRSEGQREGNKKKRRKRIKRKGANYR